MSIWNKTLAALAFSAALTVPALADGTPGQKVNRGPEPVQPHQPKSAPAPAPIKQTSSTSCCGTTTRRIVKEHPPVVTKRIVTHRQAPAQPTVTRREVTTQRTVQTRSEVRLDMASFTGGVGAGVSGGYYGGGGGAIIVTSGKRYSGVLNHGASAFTFTRRTTGAHGQHGGKKRNGGGHK